MTPDDARMLFAAAVGLGTAAVGGLLALLGSRHRRGAPVPALRWRVTLKGGGAVHVLEFREDEPGNLAALSVALRPNYEIAGRQ